MMLTARVPLSRRLDRIYNISSLHTQLPDWTMTTLSVSVQQLRYDTVTRISPRAHGLLDKMTTRLSLREHRHYSSSGVEDHRRGEHGARILLHLVTPPVRVIIGAYWTTASQARASAINSKNQLGPSDPQSPHYLLTIRVFNKAQRASTHRLGFLFSSATLSLLLGLFGKRVT